MAYDKGCHTVFYHRYHIVWATKDRDAVLGGEIRERVREIICQVCAELGVTIISGVLSRDHVHMFVSVPPQLSVSEHAPGRGRSSRRIQQEFPVLRQRCCGCHFWARGYFSTTSGNITDDVILQYLEQHIAQPTTVSR
jgi:putative transposase